MDSLPPLENSVINVRSKDNDPAGIHLICFYSNGNIVESIFINF